MTQTYKLIENRISMEAGKMKKMKNRKKHIVSFRKPCFLDVSFSFLSRLDKSERFLFCFFLFVCLFFVAYR